jgi:hypothetical protein
VVGERPDDDAIAAEGSWPDLGHNSGVDYPYSSTLLQTLYLEEMKMELIVGSGMSVQK